MNMLAHSTDAPPSQHDAYQHSTSARGESWSLLKLQFPHARFNGGDILGLINAMRAVVHDDHLDAVPVFYHLQLLEILHHLQQGGAPDCPVEAIARTHSSSAANAYGTAWFSCGGMKPACPDKIGGVESSSSGTLSIRQPPHSSDHDGFRSAIGHVSGSGNCAHHERCGCHATVLLQELPVVALQSQVQKVRLPGEWLWERPHLTILNVHSACRAGMVMFDLQ